MTEVKQDGRDTRWESHRAKRREELVSHALRAIRSQGAGIGMEEIAARAGTSKTVIYRHFGDRAGLYAAVVASVHAYIHEGLTATLEDSEAADLTALVAELADTYLRLVEQDPEIYRFTLHRPARADDDSLDPAGSLTAMISEHIGVALGERLVLAGRDAAPAETWAHGLVGFIRAAADHWMATDPRPPRDTVVAQITDLFAPAFTEAMRH
ncbi:TetR/AcrR family transcriptional regulator [Demequina sp. NBRC 110054]|uniref:TetR/AcrR family transcriptional regulator n=1 Tax=Demequina sp. NBRC 110054 TaxID=1570343 RepID=UPI000A01D46F|nr:TetR family transcriptional regulator [Demequina sp. NBRC 110054]